MEDKSNNQQKMEDINKNNVFVSADDIKTEAIIKRTEKVVSALCLVTNLLSDSDPVKWGIRDKGVTLLSRLFPPVIKIFSIELRPLPKQSA